MFRSQPFTGAIDVNNMNIADLTGIEALPVLRACVVTATCSQARWMFPLRRT